MKKAKCKISDGMKYMRSVGEEFRRKGNYRNGRTHRKWSASVSGSFGNQEQGREDEGKEMEGSKR